jgi:hypothetical protein
LQWHEDRVGDADPSVAAPEPAPRPPWELPVLS